MKPTNQCYIPPLHFDHAAFSLLDLCFQSSLLCCLLCLCWLQVGVRVFHEEDVDTGLSFLKLNEVGPATTEMVDNEIKRLLQVCTLHDNFAGIF